MSAYASRRLGYALLVVFFLSGGECSPRRDTNPEPAPPAPTPLQAPIVEWSSTTAAICTGGNGASPGTMSGNELTLANLITLYRGNNPLPPDPINVGVAQFQAADMAKHGAVSLVASDGEDALMRITCSGGTASTFTGVIVVGFSTDPQAVMNALQADVNAAFVIADVTDFANTVSVGYSNGYWMIILQ
jgi:hypothetical protein